MVFLWFSYGFPMVFQRVKIPLNPITHRIHSPIKWWIFPVRDLFDLSGAAYAAPGIPMKSTLKQLGVSSGATLLALPVPRPIF